MAASRINRRVVVLLVLGVLTSVSLLNAATWYACTWQGLIYDFDPVTGIRSNPRLTLIEALVDIEFAADGQMYGMTAYTGLFDGNPAPDTIFRIDPTTGQAVEVGGGVTNAVIEGDFALDPTTGTLYGVQDVQPGPGDRLLFTVDQEDWDTSTVGAVAGGSDLSGLTFDAAGNLYVLDTSTDIVMVLNPATGGVLDTFPTVSYPNSVAGMEYDPDSGLILTLDADGAYRTINPVTQQTTTINDLDNLLFSGLTLDPGVLIFTDGFESGDISAWE